MTITQKEAPFGCSVEATTSVIGGRWKAVILFHLMKRRMRNGELLREIEGLSQRVLTNQLRELEEDGIVRRHIYSEVPPRVEYEMTDYGASLRPILLAMREWGITHLERLQSQAESHRHTASR